MRFKLLVVRCKTSIIGGDRSAKKSEELKVEVSYVVDRPILFWIFLPRTKSGGRVSSDNTGGSTETCTLKKKASELHEEMAALCGVNGIVCRGTTT